jgi:hypothetical protein
LEVFVLSRKKEGDIALFSNHDREIRDATTARLAKDADYIDEILTDFPIYVRRMDLTRFIVRYDLFRQALEVPGFFVEIGVYKGEGLLTWAKLLDMTCPGDTLRRVIGFDNFAGFADFHAHDGKQSTIGDKRVGGWNPSHAKQDLEYFIELFQRDRFLPRSRMIELVVGDVRETAKRYVEENPGLRIALLNLDVDLYEPTLAALETLYPLVAPGGLVLVDEYGAKTWPGPAQALTDYFGDRMPRLRKHPLFTLPGAYFIKE